MPLTSENCQATIELQLPVEHVHSRFDAGIEGDYACYNEQSNSYRAEEECLTKNVF